MASFKNTFIKQYPRSQEVTADNLYWKLEPAIIKREYGAISFIDFSHFEPYNFAVTNYTRLHIYNSQTNQIVKTFSRFKQNTYSGCFRSDGNLLVVGGDEGIVRLLGVEKDFRLRTFKGHTAPVHVSRFTADNVRVFSGSDDLTLRLWDVPTETCITTFQEHKDVIRCGANPAASPDIILSGGYDHLIKMFDTRLQESVLTVDHGYPVESVLMFPSVGLFFSAGGNCIKVWDALAGGKLLKTISHHHKSITSLGFCSDYKRLLSGSLDRHVKMYDTVSYQVVNTFDYPGPILSVAVSPDDSVIVAGTTDGLLSIQHRKKETDATTTEPEKRVNKSSYRYRINTGKYVASEKDDLVIANPKKKFLPKWDKQLKAFKHSSALDSVLDIRVRMKHPEITVSVMQELIRRNVIKSALLGRNERQLLVLLKFISVNIRNMNFMSTLVDVTNIILDLYSTTFQKSSNCSESLIKFHRLINNELKYLKICSETLGMIDLIFAAAELNTTRKENGSGILH
ncbi:U3 small nucleolar RNA-associated protein 15 homolog [Octopus bimaculoides]|uniref:U3 small nucleolar RNA-associated protein 15 homolog n=1 Tax=Octopus bimaculoides TaxID=37653 RepID=A0A0L8GH92_OCTBM|nr:U3 small nucleolar RNA-associated protein 15 homolog [Octopus bimaculoides]|eukprot:XP_014781089.1 PREDICTED: U3 small nucleolar RNA-associated protein 15 homolog [Octopus bimaculoides]